MDTVANLRILSTVTKINAIYGAGRVLTVAFNKRESDRVYGYATIMLCKLGTRQARITLVLDDYGQVDQVVFRGKKRSLAWGDSMLHASGRSSLEWLPSAQ